MVVRASYNENVSVTTDPPVTFSSTTGRAARPWFVTSFSNRTATNVDRLDVYTDVERLPDVPFKDSEYNDGTADNPVVNRDGTSADGQDATVVDGEGDVVNVLGVSGTQDDTASSSFPSTTTRPKSFDVAHRGMNIRRIQYACPRYVPRNGSSNNDGDMDGFSSSDRNTQLVSRCFG